MSQLTNIVPPLQTSLIRQYTSLAIPTILSGWVYTIYTLIDGIFIARYLGQQAIAALNLVVPLLYIPYAFSIMIGVGGATLISRLLGQNRHIEARRAFTQVLWSMLAISAIMSVFVLVLTSKIAKWLGATGELAMHAEAYLSNYAWFILFANGLYAIELFLRVESAKAARFGLYAMFIGAITNGALDYWFIVVENRGMAGAALATGLSMMVSSLGMFSYHILFAKRVIPLTVPFAKGESYISKVLYNGTSEFLDAIAPLITILAFNRIIMNGFGEAGLAAFAILEYMTLGAAVTLVALVQSMQPMISFYRGMQNRQALRGSFKLGIIAAAGFSMLAAIGMMTLSRPLTFLFLPEGEIAWHILTHAIPWYALSLLPAAGNLIIAGYLTAIEAPGPSAVIATLRSWILLLGSLWLLNTYFGGTAIWYALLITEILTLVASIWLYSIVDRGDRGDRAFADITLR
ncbi:MATE family efflux transporter [Candidatus Pandoraea novymonadis]|uniref:Multidrug export protein MepA n=1 Tax=Candidatus Pandoraea novymonadis TaxID=1808959 RepID=A0ABX5FE95_9BURK|nr:MATE family efflux transporter [Candidatus Pandoraea novymonadis]PSB92010.1 Multidrug export protein MepA [Candidatus Pandoraea novymonadis]